MRSLKDRPYALHFPKGEGRTEQAHAGETDINTIMAKARRGEHSDYISDHEGQYGFASRENYFEANILIAQANTMFEELPAKIRSRFNHDPGQFLEFVQDPKNQEEMVELKLKNPPTPTPTPTPTPLADPETLKTAETEDPPAE